MKGSPRLLTVLESMKSHLFWIIWLVTPRRVEPTQNYYQNSRDNTENIILHSVKISKKSKDKSECEFSLRYFLLLVSVIAALFGEHVGFSPLLYWWHCSLIESQTSTIWVTYITYTYIFKLNSNKLYYVICNLEERQKVSKSCIIITELTYMPAIRKQSMRCPYASILRYMHINQKFEKLESSLRFWNR